jgi:hypothetical protein
MSIPAVNLQAGSTVRVKLMTSGLQGSSGIGKRFTVAGTSRTLAEADKGSLGEFSNAATCTVTVPAGLSDFWECSFLQLGAGKVTIAAAPGVTILSAYGFLSTYAQYSIMTLLRLTAADTFLLVGDMST